MYFELSINSWITFHALKYFPYDSLLAGDYMSLAMCAVFLVFILGMPFYIILRFDKLQNDGFSSDHNLMLGIDLQKKFTRQKVVYPLLYMGRRLLFVSVAFN